MIAQDEATSVVWGMPGQVAHAGLCSAVLPLDEIAPKLTRLFGGERMTPQDYDYLRKLLKQRSGLVLSAEKQYLAESRLLPVARRHGLTALHELVGKLKGAERAPLGVEVVEAMTTNETFFFRDKMPFEHFRDTILPALIAARAREKRIRIWCAAASTGQEPYSLAMSLKGWARQLAGWRIEILATDLSGEVLEKAKAGIYSQFEVQRGLPIQMLVKHFTQVGEAWQIAPELRAHGAVPPDQSAQRFFRARHIRHRVLPQRADLFRPGDQDRRAQPPGAADAGRRLSGARRRRDRGRPDRRLQAGGRQARALRAQRRARRRQGR